MAVLKFEKRSDPGEPVTPIDPTLGSRLKERRKELGKTQQQVAEEASLTVGFISQIERGISTPSLASLYNVAKALETTVDQFVSDSPAHKHSVVTHSGKRQTYKVGGTSRYYEFLERGFPEAQLNACISHVPVGHASEMMSHEGEDFVYLVAGQMLYEVDGMEYRLGPGDTLHFDSRRPHRGTNIGDDTAIELWVGTMRLFPRMSMIDPAFSSRLSTALAAGPAELFRLLSKSLKAIPGVRTVTYLAVAPDKTVTHRIGTSDRDNFPIGTWDPIDIGGWSVRIFEEKGAVVANSPEQMEVFIPETDELIAMGYGALVCAPIVIAGEVRGVVCALGDTGYLTPQVLAEIYTLLPIAALIFTIEGISKPPQEISER